MAGSILYTARGDKPEAEAALGATRADLGQLLAGSDVVSIHAAASAETAGLIGASELGRMRPGAILVNTARGTLVDSEALAAALERGTIGAAGLDVYENEPQVPAALLAAPNCVLLPHVGSATVQPATRWRTWSPTRCSRSSTAASRRTGSPAQLTASAQSRRRSENCGVAALDLDDLVGRDVRLAGGGEDRVRRGRLVEAVGAPPVGAEEREEPADSLVAVDLLDQLDVVVA